MITGPRLLVLAPHTDDGELGAGASIAKWTSAGRDVFYVAVSGCESVVPEGLAPDTLRSELLEATGVLGIPEDRVLVLEEETRTYWQRRQSILEAFIRLRTEINPNIVLAPSLSDVHQDHEVVAREAFRAFKDRTMLGYEMPWNNTSFQHTVFSPVEAIHVECKIDALACYHSQASRPYLSPEFTRAQLMFRGVQAGTGFAEVFDTPRVILQ